MIETIVILLIVALGIQQVQLSKLQKGVRWLTSHTRLSNDTDVLEDDVDDLMEYIMSKED